MKAFAVVNRGFEPEAMAEINEIAGASSAVFSPGVVVFEAPVEKLCVLAYRAQSISRLCALLAEFPSKSMDSALKGIEKSKITPSDWSDGTFTVETDRHGSHDFNSHDFSLAVIRIIGKNSDFRGSELCFYAHIRDEKGYLGVDLAGFEIGKREYRIFGHSSDLKATAAYSLLRLAGYDAKKTLLDPFSRSGAIAIEAALFASGKSSNYYRKDDFAFTRLKPFSKIDFEELFALVDSKINKQAKIFNLTQSLAHLRSAEKNAKIAEVNKLISFSRVDMEFLDMKFGKGKADLIVSYPPIISRASNPEKIRELYSDFFYQADFVLSKKGKVAVAARNAEEMDDAAKKYFKILEKRDFMMGEEARAAIIFVRK